jgi:hypothetical protein
MPELSVSRRRALAAVALLLLALIVAVRQLGGSDAPTAAARLEIGHTGA